MLEEKLQLEILGNRFQAIVDEMALSISRTAHTVFVKETQDYGAALVSTNGEVFAAPRRYGVLMMIGMPMDDAIRCLGDDVDEGDIFISNDPESTKGMATHLSDVFLWKPIFYRQELMCYAWTFIHVSDIGGRVAGSIAPSSYEIFQEGIRIPPRKLFHKGVLDEGFLNLFLSNCRIPDQNWGDMKACLAGLQTAERRVHELLDHYGPQALLWGIDATLDYAERQARRIIARVPDGTYTFIDYVEADMVGEGLVRIRLDLTIAGDEMLLDFTGTDPQIRAALNIPTYGKNGHWMLITGLVNWLCTAEPSVTYNAGLVRPMQVRIPEGSLLRPDPGAACGARYSTSHRVCDVTIGALAQAVPYEVPAFDSGQGSILLVAVPDLETGATKVSVVQPIVGGSGARPHEDGVDGTMVILNFLRNVPTESIENDMPLILIRRYGLRPDSGGPGRYRGGHGIEIELQTFSPFTTITSRCMERYIFPPPGRLGGSPGATGYTLLNPGTGRERDIGKIDILHLEPGDILRIGTQGGGGFGDPLDRPAELVEADVRNALVSRQAAQEAYGVIIDERGDVDHAATLITRSGMRQRRGAGAPPLFSYGAARDAYRRHWPAALEDALNGTVASLPTALRQFTHRRLKRAIEERIRQGTPVTPEDVAPIAAELRRSTTMGYPVTPGPEGTTATQADPRP
jgi:N-methylhydantoinase B